MGLHDNHEGDYCTGDGGYVCIRGRPTLPPAYQATEPWLGAVYLYAGYDRDGEVVELPAHVAKEIIRRLQKAVAEAERQHR